MFALSCAPAASLMRALEFAKLSNYQSLDPVEFLYECLMSEVAQCCEPSFL